MGNDSITLDKVSIEISASADKAGQNINTLTNALNGLRSAVKNSSGTLSKLSSKLSETNSAAVGFKNFGSVTKSVSTVTNNSFKSLQKQNDAFFKSLSKNASSAISKIKQIGLSLLGTRTIFTATRKAVSEYMAMDADLTWKITNNWRALGAQLAPAIENVTYLFKQFVRVIYSVILALTGIDLIARANEKAMEGWGKAAKKTLGNLQKFDDLNVVEFPKSSGFGDDKLIELDTIDLTPIQKIIEWVRRLRDEIKEAWNSGQWEGVGTVLADGLNAAIRSVNFDWIESKFETIAGHFGDFLHGVVDNFDWSTFGTQLTRQLSLIPRMIITFLNQIPWEDIGTGLNKALTTFDPMFLIDSILGSVNTLVLGIQSALLKIDGKVLGRKISDAIISIFNNFGELLSKIEWEKLGQTIRETIENIDWKSIWDGVVKIFKESFGGISDFFDGLLGTNGTGGAIAGGVLGGLFAIKEAPKAIGFIDEMITKAGSLGTAFKLLGDNTLSTASISGITGVAKPLLDVFGALGANLPIIGAVIAGIVVLGTAIADLWKNNEEFRATVESLFNSVKSTVLPIIDTILSTVKQLWKDVITPLFNLLVEIAKPFIVAIVEILDVLWKNVLQPLVEVLTNMLKDILPPIIKVLNDVISVTTWLWKNVLGPIVDFILHIVIGAIQLLTGDVDGAMETISGAFLNIIEAGKNLWKKLIDIFKKIVDGINEKIDKMKKDWDTFWDNLKKSPKEMLQGLINLINKVIGKINDKLSITIGEKTAKLLKFLGVNNISEGKYQIFSIPTIPSLDIGTNEIPYEGLYHLHPGEAVVPEKYNPALGGGTNEETNRRLDRLLELISDMETTNIVQIGNDTVYKAQQRYIRRQNDKYGTDVNL